MTATSSNPTTIAADDAQGTEPRAEHDAEQRAAAFTAAVRARLSDLTPEELDELLDGLQGDLTERLADEAGDLGDPRDYADELRQAAGLPDRGTRNGKRPRQELRVAARESWASTGERFTAHWAAARGRRSGGWSGCDAQRAPLRYLR